MTDLPAKRSRPWVVGVLAVALVGVTAMVGVSRFHLLDAYRPGTSHRVTVMLTSCVIPGDLYLDQRTWSPEDPWPLDWPYPTATAANSDPAPVPVPGTLDVTAEDEATFTPDHGASAHYHRLAPNEFSDLRCPIR